MGNRTYTWVVILVFICGLLAGLGLSPLLFSQKPHTEKTVIVSSNAPEPVGPYHQAVRYGDLVFLSGQIGLYPGNGSLAGTTEEQTVQAMENLNAIVQESQLDFSDVVQARIYVINASDWDTINKVYGRYFEGAYPARAAVKVAGLPKDAKVEIEMIARVC